MKRSEHKQHKRMRRKTLYLLGAGIVLAGITAVYILLFFGGRLVIDKDDLTLKAASTVENQDGEVIAEFYEENREPVKFDKISEHVKNAFVSIEDARFYKHHGIDLRATARALYRDILAMSKVEGGSTITQQTAKNLFFKNDKTFTRKAKEAMAAIYLERQYTKKQILEYYLNEIYFAHGLYGIESAANYYFNKSASDLTLSESAMLAALSKAPNTYSPNNNPDLAKERRNLVLDQMEEQGYITAEEKEAAQAEELGVTQPEEEQERPWIESYIDLVAEEAQEKYDLSLENLRTGGYRIVVNVDEDIQRTAYNTMQDDTYFDGSTDSIEGAFVMLDQNSGKIVAAVGAREFQYGDINRVTVQRQPGSVMKPLAVYGPALDSGDYNAYSELPDEKKSYDDGKYTVSNHNDQYEGDITMYEAVQESKNTTAVWLLDQIGIKTSKSYLEKMHIDLPEDKGLSIALGGLKEGLTPLKIAEGFRTFAHEGQWIESQSINAIYDRNGEAAFKAEPQTEDVFSEQTAWDMTRMLQGVITGGTGTAGTYYGALAGKTGTTQHPTVDDADKDAWFAGYTPEYVAVSWMGYDKTNDENYLESGSSMPTALTKSILRQVSQYRTMSTSFEKPENAEDIGGPVELPTITDASISYGFGGLRIVNADLTWTASDDKRIIYHIYKETDDGAEKIGEVQGKGSFTVDKVNPLKDATYYVVPFNPLTDENGAESNHTVLSGFGF
ncbi:transglycosylase domain-containing protein [Terribacillus saccharophilus]|uniref:Penicillin-binding protein n=1 Tax=Terribacillus saccharophilus TaxID=361277 RepID=A0A268A8P0_9BACI|nr:PBP1A family penicillin-binding protein [Terribacillus saccharophilus]PAD20487.1 penicillin-binding protein [Terribacillus saccharophilus]